MNNIITIAVFAAFASTSAFAQEIDSSSYDLVVTTDNLEFRTTSTDSNMFSSVGASIDVMNHRSVFDSEAYLSFGADYTVDSKAVDLYGSYNVEKGVDNLVFLGSVQVDYLTNAEDLSAGTWNLTPEVGVEFNALANTVLFANVENTFDVSNDFADLGGNVEVGAEFALASNVDLTPSVIQEFNTENEDTLLNIELTLNF